MQPEDIGPILAMVEREERRKWRREQEEALREDDGSRMPSPRAARARHFAYQIMHMLSKHIPEACHNEALTELMVNAYGHDLEIAQVPPSREAERKAALRAAEVSLMPRMIIPRTTND